jgi:phosphoglycerate kinase
VKTLKDFNFKNKRVLVRCDFNIPLSEKGVVLDDFRIKQTIPTIEYLIEKGGKIILMSHLDEPDGKVVESLRLTPIQDKLMEYLDLSVTKAPDCIGKEIEKWAKEMQSGEVLLLENLRFYKGEEENDENFAKELSALGDIYINDAFGACHRAHASITGIPKYLPSGMGLLLEKEIKVLTQFLENPLKPLVGIIGGKKVETKSKAIDKISEKADWILINLLIKNEIKEKKIQLKYPQKIVEPIDAIYKKGENLDIGPKTIELFKEKIARAKTIFWSGPLGKIEEKSFQKGSKAIAKAIIDSGAFSIVGGGETVEFINKMGLSGKFNHLSTGGGAMLDFIAEGKLVGLEALTTNKITNLNTNYHE